MSNPGIWLGLLKWSLGQGDGTLPTSDSHEMSADDRAFLENVMKECVVDEPRRMQEIMTRFVELLNTNQTEANVDEVIDKLQELKDIVGQIDMAQTFVKFGGPEALLRLIELPELELEARAAAAATFGTVCQNNPDSQQVLFAAGVLTRLANIFIASRSGTLRAKVLYSVSCLVRNFHPAEEQFVAELAESLFRTVASSEINSNSALWTRGLYFASALLTSDSTSPDRVRAISPIFTSEAIISECLSSSNVDTREALINFLNAVINSAGGALLVNPYKSTLLAAVASREALLSSDDLSKSDAEDTRDQVAHERDLIADLVALLEGRRNSGVGSASSPQLLLGAPPSAASD